MFAVNYRDELFFGVDGAGAVDLAAVIFDNFIDDTAVIEQKKITDFAGFCRGDPVDCWPVCLDIDYFTFVFFGVDLVFGVQPDLFVVLVNGVVF